MKKTVKTLTALVLTFVLIFGAIIPAAAQTGTITVNGKSGLLAGYGINRYNGEYGFTTERGVLKLNNLPSDGMHNEVSLKFTSVADTDDQKYYYSEPVYSTDGKNAVCSLNDLQLVEFHYRAEAPNIYGEDGYYIMEEHAKLPAGTYELAYMSDPDEENCVQYQTYQIEVDRNLNIGFYPSQFYRQNEQINQKTNYHDDYMLNFYRSYGASNANLSAAELEIIRELANEICTELEAFDLNTPYYQTMMAHHILATYLHYDLDAFYHNKTVDLGIYHILKSRRTVCSGFAAVFSAVLSAMNIPNRIVNGYGLGQGNDESLAENHAWNEVYLNGQWCLFDVTWDCLNTYEIDENQQEVWQNSGSFGEYYANSCLETFAEGHLAYRKDKPENTYLRMVRVNGQYRVTTENLENCYFVVDPVEDFANGTPFHPDSFKLPKTVTKVTPNGTTTVPVEWLIDERNLTVSIIDSNGNVIGTKQIYDPDEKQEQTFRISGRVDIAGDGSEYKQIGVVVTVLAAAPNAPTVKSVDMDRVELNAVPGCEYSMDGKNWQSSTVFTGLNPDTDYQFYCRIAQNEEECSMPSSPSAPVSVHTLQAYLRGDADNSGIVNLKDAALVAQMATGWSVSGNLQAADCDGDGVVTVKDVVLICRTVVNTRA